MSFPPRPTAPAWAPPGTSPATPTGSAPGWPPPPGPAPAAARPAPPPARPAPARPAPAPAPTWEGEPGPPPSFLRDIARTAPRLLTGVERLRFFAAQVDALDADRREALRVFVEQFVGRMHPLGASDIDMGGPACAGRAWYRVDGDKKPTFELGVASNDEVDLLVLNLLTGQQRDDLFTVRSADFSYQLEDLDGTTRRFRATTYFDTQHLGLCMRAINETARSLDSIGFHPLIARGVLFRNVRSGLALITGVTGSGKSSTLDAIIDANNHDFDGHIVIVAKPIEYIHAPDRCIIRHREVGPDVPSFKDGVSQALRQDPDIIMIGEMRDPETIDSAIEAADTGHKVFSTLHTASAVESLDRIVAEYPPAEQNRVRARLADVLNLVVSQKLPPKIGGGRVLAKEVLWVTPSVKAAILNNNTGEIYQMIWEGGHQGMVTLEQDLARLVRERKVTPAVGLQYSNNKRRFQQLVQGG